MRRGFQMRELCRYTEPTKWAELVAMNGTPVKIDVVGEEIIVGPSEMSAAAAAGAPAGESTLCSLALKLSPSANSQDWLVGPEAYADGVVGSKSSSLSKLAANAAIAGYPSLTVPASSALPFGAFDRAIRADPACLEKVALAAAAVTAADDIGDAYLRREALKVVRDTIVHQLAMPAVGLCTLESS
jgi:alpha-glucan,water dikinase